MAHYGQRKVTFATRWSGAEDSNPQKLVFDTSAYANFATARY